MAKGLFITFEGVDGCGKSTQMRFLAEHLKENGYDIVCTREPGGSPIAEKVREILLDIGNGEMTDNTEALLYAAARAQHVAEVIRPAIEAGRIVLCDRFIDSSLAYQGVGRDLGVEQVFKINEFAIDGVMPDYTFFLDFPPHLAFERMSKKRVHDRLETQEEAFYKKLYDGFVMLSNRWPQRILRIDASGDKFQTKEIVRGRMNGLLERHGLLHE
ncbi:dTMP kinase [Christensenellaceae bacterium OttesenSCG-928-K19]|nr:dTMP kinase [Christensenellaceae bacterium OttesenSCG-928-K19]